MSILPSVPGAKKRPGDARSAKKRALAVCDRILDGMSLGKACEAEGLGKSALLRLVRQDEALRAAYTTAKQEGVEAGLSNSDDGLAEAAELARKNRKGARAFVTAQAALARRAEWRAERLLPKVYGTRIDLNHSGSIDLAGRLNAARERMKGKA